MENSLHETKEIQWDWDEDDEGVVAEQVVIDGKKYIDIDYFNQKMYDHEQRFQDQSDLIEKLKSENHALISDNAYQEADLFEFNSRIEQLQKKLAEKEKENELMARTLRMFKCIEKEVNEDKISFAVEQLNQAKGKIQHNILFVDCDDYVSVIEEIDNQIAELTHQHEDKGETNENISI